MNNFQLLLFRCYYWLITYLYCHVQLIWSAKISIDYSFNYPASRDLSWRYVSTFSTIARTSDLGFKFIWIESRLPHKEQQKDSRLLQQPQNQNLPTDYRRSTHLKRGIRAPLQASQQLPFWFCLCIDRFNGAALESHVFQGFPRVTPPILSGALTFPTITTVPTKTVFNGNACLRWSGTIVDTLCCFCKDTCYTLANYYWDQQFIILPVIKHGGNKQIYNDVMNDLRGWYAI